MYRYLCSLPVFSSLAQPLCESFHALHWSSINSLFVGKALIYFPLLKKYVCVVHKIRRLMDHTQNVKMELDFQYRYYVIHFLELPYQGIEEYVCVPQSWIRSFTRSDQRTFVAYPSENSLTTREMVKTRRKAENEWEFYLAVMKYGTDYYHDAKAFIKAQSSTVPKKDKTPRKRNGVKTKPAERKTQTPKESETSYRVKSQKYNPIAPLRLSLKKPTIPLDLLKTVSIKLPRIDQEIKALTKLTNPKSTQETLTEDQLLSILEDSPRMHPQEINVVTSTIVNAVVDRACNQSNTKNETNSNTLNATSLECSNQVSLTSGVVPRNPEIDQRSYNTESIAMSTTATANQPCQIAEHSKNTSPAQEWPASKTITERSKESNDTARGTYIKVITKNTNAQNASSVLIDQIGQTSKYCREKQCSLDGYKSALQLQIQEMIARRCDKSYSNYDGNVSLQNQNLPPTMQNYQNATNIIPQTSDGGAKTTYKIDAPVFHQYDPRVSIQKPPEATRSIDQRPAIIYGVQGTSEVQAFENIMYQNSPFLHAQPASFNYPRQDLQKPRIHSKISTEANKVPQQSVIKNPMVQNISKAGNHSCRSSECSCEKHLSPTLKLCLLQSQPVQKNHEKPTGGNSMDLRANLPGSTQYTLSMPSRLQTNQFDQYSIRSKEAPIPPADENYSQNPQQIVHSGALEMNGIQRAYPQSIPQIQTAVHNSSNGVNQSCCSCKYSHEKQPSTIVSDLNQNPRLQEALVRPAKGNYVGQTVYQIPNTEKIILTSEENLSNIVNRLSECSVKEPLNPTHGSPNEVVCAVETPTPIRNNVNDLGQSTRSGIVTEDTEETKDTAVQSSPNAIDNISPDFQAAAEQLLMEQFTKVFDKMRLTAVQIEEVYDRKCKALMNYNKILEEVIEKLTKCCELTNSSATASETKDAENQGEESKNATNKKRKRKIKKPSRYGADDNDEDDEDNVTTDDEDDHHPRRKRLNRSFVLPPEYNPDNTKWTLRYHKSVPGVEEILPASRVYINKIALANCKSVSKDHNTFARMLLTEIFTPTALRVCSLTGARAQAYHSDGAPVRPGLDGHARTVLMTYVDLYGRDKGWGQCDVQSVLNSIRSKIQDLRVKYAKYIQTEDAATDMGPKIKPKIKKCPKTDDDDEDDDPECFYCSETWSKSKHDDGWIRCSVCKRWAHEACSGCDDLDNDFLCEFCS